jgi:hypothetical protein
VKEKLSKKSPEADWAANALKKQGDELLSATVAYMKAHDISRVSVEAITKAMIQAKRNPESSHIRSAIKDLMARELLGREGQTYFLTRKAKENADSTNSSS